ncbi:MAG: SBBP repeat-containing protein [Chloroflexi bacterium]|nr:SBBP repeat-containing protein [Chloroflexota bacterium]
MKFIRSSFPLVILLAAFILLSGCAGRHAAEPFPTATADITISSEYGPQEGVPYDERKSNKYNQVGVSSEEIDRGSTDVPDPPDPNRIRKTPGPPEGSGDLDDLQQMQGKDEKGNLKKDRGTLGSAPAAGIVWKDVTKKGVEVSLNNKPLTSNNGGWVRPVEGLNWGENVGITSDSEGNIYMAGRTEYLQGDVFMQKCSKNGDVIFTRVWRGKECDAGFGIALDEEGNIYVSGHTDSFGDGDEEALLLKYDRNGNHQWTRTWGGKNDEWASDVTVSKGYIYVTGRTNSFRAKNNFDAFLLKYDKNGKLIWSRRWGKGEWDEAPGITSDSEGNIYMAGTTVANSREKPLFFKYDAAGKLFWVKEWTSKGR